MKNHISIEQLVEVDLVKLSKIIKNELFDRFLTRLCHQSVPLQIKAYERMAKIITIGKLIEILEDPHIYKSKGRWLVEFNHNGCDYEIQENEIELVDALWEAVREMLKGE